MQKIVRIAALAVVCFTLVLLALVYVAGRQSDVARPGAPGSSAGTAGLHLRWSRGLSAPDPAGMSPAFDDTAVTGGSAALALASAALVAGGAAFLLGSAARSRRAAAQRRVELALAPRIEPSFERAEPSPPMADDENVQTPEEAALARMAEALEERDLEVQSLGREIENWQEQWRVAAPRLADQEATIAELKGELAAARSTVAGMRRYVGELRRQGVATNASFTDDIDAWVARFSNNISRA
jgi:hypothetical protein